MFEFLNLQPFYPFGIRILHIIFIAVLVWMWSLDKKFFSTKRTPKTLSPLNTAADQGPNNTPPKRSAATRLFKGGI